MKRLRKVIDGARFWLWLHGGAAVAFISFWIWAWATGAVNSVALISHLSFIALAYGALSAWQSSRTEARQERAAKELTDHLVEHTTIELAE